jgi:uncharacterized protein (TIGR03435 family)
MRVLFARLTLAALLSTCVVAQSPAPAPSFDVADVHIRPHTSNAAPQMNGGLLRAGRYDIRNATMLDLISKAYGVDAQTVFGGPNWLARDRFDIIAKAPDGTKPETLQLMLKSLLMDRFKLVVHNDTKLVPSYILAVNGAPKMKAGIAPSGDDANKPACQAPETPVPPTSTGVPFGALSCHGVTMDAFAQLLPSVANAYVTSRVVDQTGLKGNWDFDIKWSPRAALARAGSEGVTLTAALDQLGLKVTYDKAPGPVLVVDSVGETPTPNPSGTAESLPAPLPAEFDVADIKVAAPDTQANGRLLPNGRLDFQGITMKVMFQLAWDINDDDLLAGAPKWFDTTKYSLVAKASSITSDGNGGVQIDFDDTKAMLRALLVERFKIVTHIEQRPVDAYTLVVADKAKLLAADATNRTRWFNGVLPGVKDPRDANPSLNRAVTVQNMTMAQFAEDLTSIAGGYIKEPVVDATGLDGAWDFLLSFSGIGVVNNGRGGDASAGALAASAPTGALSLFDALQKELGLKLEQHKRPMPVLVIDHIDEQPSDR